METSPDGVHYSRAAAFDGAGVADATLHNDAGRGCAHPPEPRPGPAGPAHPRDHHHVADADHPRPGGPGRGFPDISQAPDLAVWAQKAEKQMEAFWPDTDALLYSDRFIPPNMVNVVYRTGPDVTGVAATGGGVMTVNTAWCRAAPGGHRA